MIKEEKSYLELNEKWYSVLIFFLGIVLILLVDFSYIFVDEMNQQAKATQEEIINEK